VCGDFEISDEHTLRLLEQACGCLDRIEQAREAIEKTGLTFEDRFGQRRMTPEVLIERDMRSLFMRLIRELGFDLPATESRPPRRYS
jgi:phage terminase small subunit